MGPCRIALNLYLQPTNTKIIFSPTQNRKGEREEEPKKSRAADPILQKPHKTPQHHFQNPIFWASTQKKQSSRKESRQWGVD